MLLAAAASNKVSEARPRNDMFSLQNTKKQHALKASETTSYITNASSSSQSVYCCMCIVCSFVQRFCNSIRHDIMSQHCHRLICMCSQAAEARPGSHTNSKAFRRCTFRRCTVCGLPTPDADHNCSPRSCRRRDIEALQRARV